MFYKTDNPLVIEAFNNFNQKRSALHESAEAFANEYNAQPIMLQGAGSIYFAGIKFNRTQNVNFDIWRKPHRQYGYSDLRVRALKKEHQAEWKTESEKHKSLFEKYFPEGEKVSLDTFYNTLGFTWGNVLFSSFACFEHDGTLYFNTDLVLKNATEILGSEYTQFKQEHDKAARAEKQAVPQ